MKTIFLLLIMVVAASCQPTLITGFAWDYGYNDYEPCNQDTNIIFDIYFGQSLSDTNFVLYDSTQALQYSTLADTLLYQSTSRYVFVRARCLYDGAVSFPSDTIYAYFRKILKGVPYNLETVKVKF